MAKTIEINGQAVEIRELKMKTLRAISALGESDALESMVLVLSGATNLEAADIDEMDGSQLRELATAIREVNAPFFEMLATLHMEEMAAALGRIIDGLFYIAFIR